MRLILLLCAGALLAGTPRGPIVSFAGTTTSIDFPVSHAFPPRIPGSRVSLSTGAGATWTNDASPPEDLNLIVQDPGNPQMLFGAGNHIFRSTDGGHSWNAVFTDYQLPIPSLAVDPANDRRVATISYHGVTFSLDDGQTWTLVFRPCQPASSCLLAAGPFGSGTLLANCPEVCRGRVPIGRRLTVCFAARDERAG